jgi:3-methyladenine DNA glycosylase AlkD
MDQRTAMKQLEELGTAENRKVYARHGVTGAAFGVSYAALGKLRKAIGTDHGLALALWKSGNHDARVLATMVADPGAFDRKTIDAWGKDLSNYVLTDAFSVAVAASKHAGACARAWMRSRGEWLSSAGWNVVARVAADGETFAAEELEALVDRIEERIHASPNRTRHAMGGALIAIGLVNPALERRALAAARQIGPIEVDHGETSCKTPDVAGYIRKTRAHRAGRATQAGKAPGKGKPRTARTPAAAKK